MPLLLFFLYAFTEIYLLILAGGEFGAFNLLLYLIASAAVGLWVLRTQGRAVFYEARADMAEGRAPQGALLDGLLLFVGGILLILPGFISDALGLLLLIPRMRASAVKGLGKDREQGKNPFPGYARVFFYRSGPAGTSSFRQQRPPEDESLPPRQDTIIETKATQINPPPESPKNGDRF
ncbi:MAG: FxsA family protein [Desulfovibrio sp.]|jgi:UPF0716 protein FxsA|nr:FxsA family protein [Desulfovibrio sp.]